MSSRYERLCDEIRREFPRFRVVCKDEVWSQRAIGWVLRGLTLGAQSSYMTRYQTSIGCSVYVTADWVTRSDAERYVTMRHELAHLRQFRRFGLVPMALLYVFFPLPLGLAWFRARMEREGYAETVRATAEVYGVAAIERREFREYVIGQFTSGAYGWMWPFRRSLEKWYDALVTEVRSKSLA